MTLNIVVVGVGGQGILSLTKLLGESVMMFRSDLNVMIAETHGLSQRGGSVITHLRIGKGVLAPLVPKGCADLMVSMELLESVRYLSYLRPKASIAIINEKYIRPIGTSSDVNVDELKRLISSVAKYVFMLRATDEALRRGYPVGANMVIYGFTTYVLEKLGISSRDIALSTIKSISKSTHIYKINMELFGIGYDIARTRVTNDALELLRLRL